MSKRYFFTVATGRCGQSTLTSLLNAYVDDCYAAFEEPSPVLLFRGIVGALESRFRRRFIETDELLGRGKILTAFESNNQAYIDAVVKKRLKKIDSREASVNFDVSKFFARGLHKGFARACPGMGLVLLVRDPVLNMRSFLNRKKNFLLDNNSPSARSNLLQLDDNNLSKGELYLWAWCEMYLRYLDLIDTCDIGARTIIRTEDLNDAEQMSRHLDILGLTHEPICPIEPKNTNLGQGKGRTIILEDDIALFQSFLAKVPQNLLNKIEYLSGYSPEGVCIDSA